MSWRSNARPTPRRKCSGATYIPKMVALCWFFGRGSRPRPTTPQRLPSPNAPYTAQTLGMQPLDGRRERLFDGFFVARRERVGMLSETAEPQRTIIGGVVGAE